MYPATPPILELHDVGFAYRRGSPALEGVSLSVKSGNVVGIIGPNGGGKTTLLKLILGLMEPTAGTIRIDGRPPREAVRAGVVGYLPQSPRLSLNVPINALQLVELGLAGRAGLLRAPAADERVTRRAGLRRRLPHAGRASAAASVGRLVHRRRRSARVGVARSVRGAERAAPSPAAGRAPQRVGHRRRRASRSRRRVRCLRGRRRRRVALGARSGARTHATGRCRRRGRRAAGHDDGRDQPLSRDQGTRRALTASTGHGARYTPSAIAVATDTSAFAVIGHTSGDTLPSMRPATTSMSDDATTRRTARCPSSTSASRRVRAPGSSSPSPAGNRRPPRHRLPTVRARRAAARSQGSASGCRGWRRGPRRAERADAVRDEQKHRADPRGDPKGKRDVRDLDVVGHDHARHRRASDARILR